MSSKPRQPLSEKDVLSGLGYLASLATAKASFDNLSSSMTGNVQLGYALCMYQAATESDTTPPSAVVPGGGRIPKRLHIGTCPPKILPIFNRWAAVVPQVKSLSRQQQEGLKHAICDQAQIASYPEADKLPRHLPVPYSTTPEICGVAEQLFTLAQEIATCIASNVSSAHHTRSMSDTINNVTKMPQAIMRSSAELPRISMPQPQRSPFYEQKYNFSPQSLPCSPQSIVPIGQHHPGRASPGLANEQGVFVGGFVDPSIVKPSSNASMIPHLAPLSPQMYNAPNSGGTKDSAPKNRLAIEYQVGELYEKVARTETAMPIGANMPVSEVIAQLCSHGCQDLSDSLDRSSVSSRPVSRGGFGEVYQGKLLDGRSVALKTITYESYDGPKHLKNAARELHTWSKCSHPNVASLLGLVELDGRIAMVSKWIDNGNLRSYVKANPDVNRLELSIMTTMGLGYLHSVGIVHGDLKGPNVLVSSDGTPVLIDFGNSTLSDSTLQFTQTVTKHDITPRWTAPELLHNEKPSPPSDIYALGMTILEAFTGEVPYFGIRDRVILSMIGKPMPPPDRPTKSIPESEGWGNILWQILTNCWRAEPQERPTASEVCERLQSISTEYRNV